MQVFLRKLNGSSRVLHVDSSDSVDCLKQLVQTCEGVPCSEQRLMCGARQLQGSISLAQAGVQDGADVTLLLRLRGGARVALTVQPRVQKEKWSLYWKESMSTKTVLLDPVNFELDASTTIAEVQQLVAKAFGWEPLESLTRLEGFKEDWERTVYRGNELKPDTTLDKAGLTPKATVTTVRKVLVPEAWKVIKEGEEEDDLSTTDEEDDF